MWIEEIQQHQKPWNYNNNDRKTETNSLVATIPHSSRFRIYFPPYDGNPPTSADRELEDSPRK
jgi:hypothetical protein